MKPPTVVCDTNVLISALVFGGPPRRILEAAIRGVIQLATSRTLLDELVGVLEGKKFRFPPEATQLIADELVAISLIVHPRQRIQAIRTDPDDNRVLECAVASKARYSISGDNDLLTLGAFRGITIVPPARFKEMREYANV